MRTPKNSGRLPRVRSWVITYPANAALPAHGFETQSFNSLTGLREGDEITLTPLMGPTGVPYVGNAAAAQITWNASANGDNAAFVMCLNVTALPANRPEMRFRITARRP